jgi:murein DD-endopeptidase MepM/ murein hydrolase activator NlpD
MTYKNKTRDNLIVSWKPTGICKVPLIYFRGKHYILPINGYFPDESTLSDLSTETLKNTLDAGSFLKNDFRLSSFKVRTFYTQIESVLSARNTRFSLPIPGTSVPTKTTYLPGSSRPFRADATDGIHHGWDFYVSEGTPVRAIEEGIILHVKRDFSWEEMKHLQPGHTDLEEQENLDVYRGNTVYLKTRSGHVAIYAHLSDIPSHITTGKSVNRGDILGHVGDSAVPDKKYLYHLHFELAMNPFIDEKAGQHTFSDVLLWPFWGKGKNAEWIRSNDDLLFE